MRYTNLRFTYLLYLFIVCCLYTGWSDATTLCRQEWSWPGGRPTAGPRRPSHGQDEEWPQSSTHGHTGRPLRLRSTTAVTSRRYQWRHRCMCSSFNLINWIRLSCSRRYRADL